MTEETPPDDKSNMQANTKSLQEEEKLPEIQAGEAEQTNDKEQQKEEGSPADDNKCLSARTNAS